MVLSALLAAVRLPVPRKHAPALPRPFRLRGSGLWCPAGFLGAAAMIYWASFTALVSLAVVLFAGLAAYRAHYMPHRGWIGRRAGMTVRAVCLVAWGCEAPRAAVPRGRRQGRAGQPEVRLVVHSELCAGELRAPTGGEGRLHTGHGFWPVFFLPAAPPLSYADESGRAAP
ncbi:hypothetical protein [Streptomyces sp. YIM S03343]